WHKVPSPLVYRVEDALASWRKITAPVLLLIARQGFVQQRFEAEPEELERRIRCFRDAQTCWIDDAGHNIQHDQPEQVAVELEQFLRWEM
ncbi:MAG: alpha/beta fold hydrolase, partial [Azovibrio sp.]